MKKHLNKLRVLVISLIAVVTFAACTPNEAIAIHFPNEQATAHRVVRCESKYDAGAVGGPNRNGTYDHGLFQINDMWNQPGHHDAVADWIGRHWHLRYKAEWNALMAKKIRDKYGWRMWSCY